METSSIGSPPLVTLAAFAFAILLSLSSSAVQSQSTARNPPPPSPFRSPPPANKGAAFHSPRPHHHPPQHPSDKKHAEPAKAKTRDLNWGKLVGFLFAGIVVVLQIGVVGFLAYKRNQIYKEGWRRVY